MSIWSDIQDRSAGTLTRKEDPVTITEEEIINFVEKKMSIASFTEEIEGIINEFVKKGFLLNMPIFTEVDNRLGVFKKYFAEYLWDNYLKKKKVVRIPVYENLKTMVLPEKICEGKLNLPEFYEQIDNCDEPNLNFDIMNDLCQVFYGYCEVEKKDDKKVALLIYPYKIK